jgi:hypothetical protein
MVMIGIAFEEVVENPLDEINMSHVLRSSLKASSPKLTDCEGILLTKRNTKGRINGGAHDLSSPSISFNKKFKITVLGENQHVAAKIFDPSVIQAFDEMNYISPRADLIEFHNGYVNVKWQDLIRQKDQGRYCINNFSFMNYTHHNEAKAITQKIKADYE